MDFDVSQFKVNARPTNNKVKLNLKNIQISLLDTERPNLPGGGPHESHFSQPGVSSWEIFQFSFLVNAKIVEVKT